MQVQGYFAEMLETLKPNIDTLRKAVDGQSVLTIRLTTA